MAEAAEQYKARLAAYAEDKDPVAMQRQAPQTLAQLIEGVAETRLRLKPAPDKWSVTEILAHMAEDELSSSWRYRQILEHDGPELLGFDQEMWARLGNYASWKPQEALEMFRLLREANLRIVRPAHARAMAAPRRACGTRQADRARAMSPHGHP